MDDIVTVEEAAIFFHKHPGTIRHWIEEKKLKARHLSAGGHGVYAILKNDILEFFASGVFDQKDIQKKKEKEIPAGSVQPQLPLV